MFCSVCGKQAVPGETVCANCHAPFAVAGVPAGYPASPPQPGHPVYAVPSRVPRHVQILGILWAIRGAMSFLGWVIAVPFLTGFSGRFGHHGFGPWDVFHGAPFWIAFVTAFVVFHAALSLVTAYALLTRQPWGRVLAIVAAILALMSIPFGTALGIYTLIILLPADAAADYAAISTRRW
jgi:hypothetical protein